jgi:hypothetical protein
MKSLEEIFNETYNNTEIDNRVNFYIQEVEEAVKTSVIQNKSQAHIDIYYGEFTFSCLNCLSMGKIILFKLIEEIKKKNYKVTVRHMEHQNIFRVIIDYNNMFLENKLNDYLRAHMK